MPVFTLYNSSIKEQEQMKFKWINEYHTLETDYLQVVFASVAWDNTYDNLCHSRHKTAADPTKEQKPFRGHMKSLQLPFVS